MKSYNVKITETYIFNHKVEANSEKEALEKARKEYEECDEKYIFSADANSYDDTKFKIVKNR